MTTPFVSCIMPTYNRYPHYGHLVGEAVESFIRQGLYYPSKSIELVILNDTPGQELMWDSEWLVKTANLSPAWIHEHIRLINVPYRFRTLGEKYNAAVALSRGEVILPWEDDDISLPWRIKQAVQRLWPGLDVTNPHHRVVAAPYYSYFNPTYYWFCDKNGALQTPNTFGYAHNCSAYTRDAYIEAGGYSMTTGDQDKWMDNRLRSNKAVRVVEGRGTLKDKPQEWSFIYRWGQHPVHLSGRTDMVAFYKEIGQRPIQKGKFRVEPLWKRDYEKLVKDAARQHPEEAALG